jgi:hypothetical protein
MITQHVASYESAGPSDVQSSESGQFFIERLAFLLRVVVLILVSSLGALGCS